MACFSINGNFRNLYNRISSILTTLIFEITYRYDGLVVHDVVDDLFVGHQAAGLGEVMPRTLNLLTSNQSSINQSINQASWLSEVMPRTLNLLIINQSSINQSINQASRLSEVMPCTLNLLTINQSSNYQYQ